MEATQGSLLRFMEGADKRLSFLYIKEIMIGKKSNVKHF